MISRIPGMIRIISIRADRQADLPAFYVQHARLTTGR